MGSLGHQSSMLAGLMPIMLVPLTYQRRQL